MADRDYIGTNADGVPGWIRNEMKYAFAGASVLLVEDDADIRELMATVLRLAGFEPTVCSNAEFGLEQLREQAFDLVLTDYALPNRNGAWLLQQAEAEGLLEATPAIIVTAHPDPPEVDGYEVICKPFDLEHLIDRVKLRLDAAGRGLAGRPRTSSSRRPGDENGGDCPDPIELILYVSRHSPKSAAAVEHIQRVLARLESARVNLTIYDLADNSKAGAADGLAAAPGLMQRSAGPRTSIVGHASNAHVVMELLQACGEHAV